MMPDMDQIAERTFMAGPAPTSTITPATVIGIHDILVDWCDDSLDPISPAGVKDIGLIESAVGRPFQSAGGQPAYDTVFAQASALFHSLINNHAFFTATSGWRLLPLRFF